MKSEKGITLTALIIYVLVFTATLGLLANLSNFVYSNLLNFIIDSFLLISKTDYALFSHIISHFVEKGNNFIKII